MKVSVTKIEQIFEFLKSIIEGLKPKKVNGLVSDNEPKMIFLSRAIIKGINMILLVDVSLTSYMILSSNPKYRVKSLSNVDKGMTTAFIQYTPRILTLIAKVP